METQDVGSFGRCMRQPDKHVFYDGNSPRFDKPNTGNTL